VVPGLDATIDGCISFESLNFRDHYLRHLNFRIQLDQDDTPLFKTDATFCPRAGLSGHGISFEALNFPGQFVHVRRINSDAFELWVDKPQGDLTLFNKDSSFAVTASWAPLVITNVRHSFQAVQMQFQERFIRHRNPVAGGQRLASLDPINSTSTDMEKETATFMIAPALDSTTDDCISFESVDIPGSYLRHFNFRLQLDRNDGSPLFQSDATFCPREGLAGEGVSFESVNFPRRYIRHFNFELWLQHSDGSSQFHKDASFNVSVPWAGER
jgi:hypothetical protein